MKKIIKNLLFFVIIFFALNIIAHYTLPNNAYWGNKEFEKKLIKYRKQPFNTVFFGSSRILSGISPHLFDSLVNLNSQEETISYNLATPGTWSNETFYLYEHFLNDSTLSKNVKTVFMEFQNIMAIRRDKLTSNKVIYYQSLSNLGFILDYSISEAEVNFKNIPSSLFYITTYSLTTLENFLNIGRLSINETPIDSLSFYGTDDRGFLSLTRRAEHRNSMKQGDLDKYVKNISQHFNQANQAYNKPFYEKIDYLINASKKRGIRLIFILPPVMLTKSMMDVYNVIPDKNKIEVCNPTRFPELYDITNWIDETHLSINGANCLNYNLAFQYSK